MGHRNVGHGGDALQGLSLSVGGYRTESRSVISGFTVASGRFGSSAIVQIRNADAGVRVDIAEYGATLLRWQAPVAGASVDLVDSYATATELQSQAGVRSGVMVPFCNRVAQGRYAFDGVSYDLLPGTREKDRLIYHGFLRLLPLVVREAEATEDSTRVVLETTEIRPGRFPGYPFAIDVTVEYLVTERGLRLIIGGRNVGSRPAPYASGWHPYFRLGDGGIDDLELTVPGSTVIRTDDGLIPLTGRSAYLSLNDAPELDYRQARPLRGTAVDACYTDLAVGPDGRSHTVLRDSSTGADLDVWQERGLLHLFTGDTLPRDPRQSVALESVEVMTDAFNRGETTEAVTLRPGESRSFTCGVDVHDG